jgi:hypothetical protein
MAIRVRTRTSKTDLRTGKLLDRKTLPARRLASKWSVTDTLSAVPNGSTQLRSDEN